MYPYNRSPDPSPRGWQHPPPASPWQTLPRHSGVWRTSVTNSCKTATASNAQPFLRRACSAAPALRHQDRCAHCGHCTLLPSARTQRHAWRIRWINSLCDRLKLPAREHQDGGMATQRRCQKLRPLDTKVAPTVSMLDMAVCGMPQRDESCVWLSPCNSRMIRTDSPGLTSIRFLAATNLLISVPPIVMQTNADDSNSHDVGLHRVDDAPLLVQAG